MQHEVITQWMGKMQFNADVNGHTIIMDTTERGGGEDNGPIPKPLVLTALSGCSGMDVVALLNKYKTPVDDFCIKVQGTLSEDHPKRYIGINIQYRFKGNNLPKENIIKAVKLSQEQYCGVNAMLKMAMPVQYTIELTQNSQTEIIHQEQTENIQL